MAEGAKLAKLLLKNIVEKLGTSARSNKIERVESSLATKAYQWEIEPRVRNDPLLELLVKSTDVAHLRMPAYHLMSNIAKIDASGKGCVVPCMRI